MAVKRSTRKSSTIRRKPTTRSIKKALPKYKKSSSKRSSAKKKAPRKKSGLATISYMGAAPLPRRLRVKDTLPPPPPEEHEEDE